MACAHTHRHMWNSFPVILKEAFDFTSDSPKKSISEQVRCAQGFRWLQGHHIHLHRKHMDMGKLSTLLQMGFWGVFTESDSQMDKNLTNQRPSGGEIVSTWIRQPFNLIPKSTALGNDPTAVRGNSEAPWGRSPSTSQHHHHLQLCKRDKISCMSNKQLKCSSSVSSYNNLPTRRCGRSNRSWRSALIQMLRSTMHLAQGRRHLLFHETEKQDGFAPCTDLPFSTSFTPRKRKRLQLLSGLPKSIIREE